MATHYVDAVDGNDANDGLTPATAKKTYAAARTASSTGQNSVLLKRGQVHLLASEGQARNGTSLSARWYLGAYGAGSKPVLFPSWAPASSTSLFWLLSGSQFILIEDVVFDAGHVPFMNVAMNIMLTSASDINGITLRRCEFTRSSSTGCSLYWNGGTSWAANSIRNVLLEDCRSYDNKAHGFTGGGDNAVMRRCKAYRNGIGTGAHGFSIQGACTTSVTAGWTLVSGNIYSRAVANEVWGVFSTIAGQRALVKNTATPTTPAAGEYGWAAGTLYVNFAANPAGATVVFAQAKNSVTWEECEAWENYAFTPYPYVEGQGFQFDDYTSYCSALRCRSYNNSGGGFSFNNTADCTVTALVATGNARRGLVVQNSRNAKVYAPTLINNNRGGYRYPGSAGVVVAPDTEEVSVSGSPATTIRNVAIAASGLAYAVNADATSLTGSTCSGLMASGVTALFGAAGAISGSGNSIVADLLVNTIGRPTASSPLIAAGAPLDAYPMLDAAGVQFFRVPTIGAFEYVRPRAGRRV